MSRTNLKSFLAIGLGVISVCSLTATGAIAQSNSNNTQARVPRLIQSGADIAALPKSDQSETVRARFTPNPQSSAQPSQSASFYRQPTQANDVYPYPAANQPRAAAVSRSNFALSQGGSRSGQANQVGFGSNTASNLRGERYATNQSMAYNLSLAAQGQASNRSAGTASQSASDGRTPVEQQRSSTLDPVQQSRINQAAVAQRQAYQNQLAQQQRVAMTRQPATYRPTAFQTANPAARVAQNCCTPVTAGYQAAFQAPSIDSNVGAPSVNDGSGGVQGGFNQPALPQCCVPATGYQGGYGGYQFGSRIGTPQFGAQGARWWTPFFTGSGNYQPLVNLGGSKPGTYLGQGIIGQPTAYVDGQPFRNLFRYMSP